MTGNFSYEKLFDDKKDAQFPRKLRGAIGLLRGAWKIYRNKFTTFLGILGIPIGLALLYCDIFYHLSHTNFQYSFLFSVLQFLLGVAIFFLFLCSLIALIYSFKDDINTRHAYKVGERFLISSFSLCFILASLIIGGLIIGVIPGIIFCVWFSLALVILVLEGRKGFDALGRSKQLVRGMFWGILARLLLITIILAIILAGIVFAFIFRIDYWPLSNLVGSVTFYVLQIFTLPFFLIYIFLIYEDLVKIKESESYKVHSLKPKIFYGFPLLIGVLFVCFSTIMIIFGIFYGRDIPPIDDSDLRLSKVEIPREKNAYYDVEEAISKRFPSITTGESEWERIFTEMLEGKGLGTREADELIKRNEKLFSCFEKALQRPYIQLPYIENPENFRAGTLFPEFSHLRELSRWGVINANYKFAKGRETEAFGWLLNVIKFGEMIENSPRPAGIIQYLVAVAVKSMGTKSMRKLIGRTNLDARVLKNYAKELEDLVNDDEGLARSLRMEYMLSSSDLRFINESLLWKSNARILLKDLVQTAFASKNDSSPMVPIFPSWMRVYYKPNKTQYMLAEVYRKILNDIFRFYKDMESLRIEEEPQKFGEVKIVFGENILGKMFVDVLAPIVSKLLERKCLEKFDIEAVACLFALRAYQKEKGTLPAGLEELVPKYISRVPLDPFDGKPLRYSKEKRIIYCVGKDLQDNGGSIGEEGDWRDWKDPTVVIEF